MPFLLGLMFPVLGKVIEMIQIGVW